MIIGISGKAGSGKDTAAEALVEAYGFKRLAFAGPLKEIAKKLFGLSDLQMTDHDMKETVDSYWELTARQILQAVGAKMREIHPDVWVRLCLDQAQALGRAVIADVRYKNEVEAIHDAGGFVIRINRTGAGSKTGAEHPSETELDKYGDFDAVIKNNGTVEALKKAVRQAVKDWVV